LSSGCCIAFCSSLLVFLRQESCCVAQAGLNLTVLLPQLLSAGMTGMNLYAWISIGILRQSFMYSIFQNSFIGVRDCSWLPSGSYGKLEQRHRTPRLLRKQYLLSCRQQLNGIHIQRLSPKNKGVSPYTPLQAGYRSEKQGLTHVWLHVTLLATSPPVLLTFFMFRFFKVLSPGYAISSFLLHYQNTDLFVSFFFWPSSLLQESACLTKS
jgi:hypothetical protein